jgi:hypothetical protein
MSNLDKQHNGHEKQTQRGCTARPYRNTRNYRDNKGEQSRNVPASADRQVNSG